MIPAETEWMKAAANRSMTVHAGRHMLDYQRDLMGVFMQMGLNLSRRDRCLKHRYGLTNV